MKDDYNALLQAINGLQNQLFYRKMVKKDWQGTGKEKEILAHIEEGLAQWRVLARYLYHKYKGHNVVQYYEELINLGSKLKHEKQQCQEQNVRGCEEQTKRRDGEDPGERT